MVTIEFDKTRNLKFDLRAVKDYEATMGGKPLGDIVGELQRCSVTAITVGLWAGLKHEDRGITPNLATKYLEGYIAERKSLVKLARALNDAIEETGLFRREDEELAEGNGQPMTGDH